MLKPLPTLNFEEKLQSLGFSKELKENYPEKQADQKMKGSKEIYLVFGIATIFIIYLSINYIPVNSILDFK